MASYRYYFQYKEDLEVFKVLNTTNLSFLLLCYLISGIIIYPFANWFSSILFNGQITVNLIRWSFVSGCLGYLFSYLTLLLTAQMRSITFSIITISQTLLNTVFSFYFIFMYSLTYLAKIYAVLIAQGIVVICLFFLTRDVLGNRVSFLYLKKSLRFSFPLVPRQVIGLLYSAFDKVMLTQFTGLTSVGYYTFGIKFATFLKMLMDSMNRTWNPFFMNKASENTVDSKKAIIRRFYELSFFYALGGLGIIYFSEELIKLLTTKEFYPSIYVVPIYIYFHLFGIINTLAINQIMYSEKMFKILPASIAGIVFNVILNIFLIPKFGAVGAAIATAIASLGTNLVNMYLGFKVYPLPLGKRKLISLFLLVITFTIPAYPLIAIEANFIIKIAAKTAIILIFMWLGFKLNYAVMEDIKMPFKKLFRRYSY